MKSLLKFKWPIVGVLLMFFNGNGQVTKSNTFEIGFSYGPSFSGPLHKMGDYLIEQGYNSTSSGFIFGPLDYPVTVGPRDSFSLFYARPLKNENQIEIEFNRSTLGEIAGLNNSGQRVEAGFQSYNFNLNYRFGSNLTKISFGPTLMFNRVYTTDFENLGDSKNYFDNALTFGIKGKLSLYIWNREKSFFNLGLSYLLTHNSEIGPFPTSGSNELQATRLNFSHGSSFFSFGLKF